jgi:transposase
MTDAEWELIADLFPEPAATGRPPRKPRELMDAIFWVVRTGAPWRDVPKEFGPWKTVYNHFDKWNSDGTLDKVRKRLLSRFVDDDEIDKELWCIDGTIVRAARCAAGGGKKMTRENLRPMLLVDPAVVFPRKFTSRAMPMDSRFTLK